MNGFLDSEVATCELKSESLPTAHSPMSGATHLFFSSLNETSK